MDIGAVDGEICRRHPHRPMCRARLPAGRRRRAVALHRAHLLLGPRRTERPARASLTPTTGTTSTREMGIAGLPARTAKLERSDGLRSADDCWRQIVVAILLAV